MAQLTENSATKLVQTINSLLALPDVSHEKSVEYTKKVQDLVSQYTTRSVFSSTPVYTERLKEYCTSLLTLCNSLNDKVQYSLETFYEVPAHSGSLTEEPDNGGESTEECVDEEEECTDTDEEECSDDEEEECECATSTSEKTPDFFAWVDKNLEKFSQLRYENGTITVTLK